MRVLIVSALLLAACGAEAQVGNPDVYADIETMTDCDALQETFDRNMDGVEARDVGDPIRDIMFSYAEAADERMQEAGCYD